MLSDQRAYYAMLAITPIAPIVAISAVLKGYFRGKQRMSTIAASDVGIGIVILTLLNFLSISGLIGFYWDIRPYVRGGFCMVLDGTKRTMDPKLSEQPRTTSFDRFIVAHLLRCTYIDGRSKTEA